MPTDRGAAAGRPSSFVNSLFSVEGKIALVTGGASGIGLMISRALVEGGARVMIASRKGKDCNEAAEALNALGAAGTAEGFEGDVSSEFGIAALAERVRQRCDRLSILVNNAGKTWGQNLEAFAYEAWHDVLAVNVAGPFALTQSLLHLLDAAATAEDPARVVNLGSVAGNLPMAGGAYSYAASKAAIHHLTRILANELAARHITVNALAPGAVPSRMTAFATADEAKRARVANTIPLGRLGRETDIAATVLYLCGMGGSYTTGAVLPVDGGVAISCGNDLWAVAR